MTFKELHERTGMSLKQFSDYFNIPYRTIQNWISGIRTPPQYVVDLIEYKLNRENLKTPKIL